MNNTQAPPPPTIQDRALDHAEDARAIRQLVADVETAMNTNDAALAVRHFAANAWAVGVTGARIVGHEALLEAHEKAFAGFLRNEYARYSLEDITFLNPDVAIAHARAQAADADGNPVGPDPAMVALYVFAKRNGRWWVVARQNTLVPEST